MDKEDIVKKLKQNGARALALFKWLVFSILMGFLCGLAGALFFRGIAWATATRFAHPQFLFLLPVGGCAIVFFYRRLGDRKETGTNLVLEAIHSGEVIPLRLSLLIFVSTIFSHLCGASVGREGAALQIGGSLGQNVGRAFRLKANDRNTITMCGMSGVFSALFGTPIAASFFSMEVVSVGIMHYAALVPCVICSVIARAVANSLGAPAPFYDISKIIPPAAIFPVAKAAILAAVAGLVSILFVLAIHGANVIEQRFFKNRYIQALVGGSFLLLLTWLTGLDAQRYNGAGTQIIEAAASGGTIFGRDFLLKILFTAVSIACAYKGGEIVPSFYIGATFGAAFASLIGLPPALGAAVGIGALFCGVTNCPVTALLICFELFGMGGWTYYLIGVAIAYVVSGYFGVYSSQTIVYSKFRSNYINTKTHM